VLKPATVMEVEYYTDEQVKEWSEADTFKNNSERAAVRSKINKIGSKKK
jgi:hypothetical protein